jgi:hypothetical protein
MKIRVEHAVCGETFNDMQLLLACNRILHVAKVFKPNELVEMIAFREALYLAESMLAQPAHDVVCDSNVL